MPVRPPRIPPLETGDQLTRDEFERRYHAMPHVRKAELIDGVVFMPSPIKWADHASPHADLIWVLKHYSVFTPRVGVGDNGTVRIEADSEPQPDIAMVIDPAAGGQVVFDADGYIAGSPELVAEVSATTASIDLNRKFALYQRTGVLEYIVWRVLDGGLDWFVLAAGQFVRLTPDPADGFLKSVTFPGLWLDPAALVAGDSRTVLAVLSRGLASPEHAAFVSRLTAP